LKKILLIQPKSAETFWKLTGVVKHLQKSLIPPLSLATIAALTPPSYSVSIMDEELDPIDFDTPCDLVGITGFTNHSGRMFEIAEQFRRRGILTVAGGSFVTAHSRECAGAFDVLICGESEKIWPQFLADWETGSHQSYYMENEKPDLAHSPAPRWDLLDLNRYVLSSVQTSRGCPFDCEFCDVVALFGHRMRYKPIEHIIAEIRVLERTSINSIFFADDNFIGDKRYARNLLKRIIEFNQTLEKPLRFVTQLTLNISQDEELLDLLKQANFFAVFIGIETPKRESLVETNKRSNLFMDMREAIRQIQSRGIYIISGLMVGFDSDDLDTFALQKEFLIQTGLCAPMPATLKAPKGTKLWDRMEKENRLIEKSNETFADYEVNFFPKNMTPLELEENYLSLFQEVYGFKHFLMGLNTIIQNLDPEQIAHPSPLSMKNRARSRRQQLLELQLVIYYFVISGGAPRRAFFFSALRLSIKRGLAGLNLLQELLIIFISQNTYIGHLLEQRGEIQISMKPTPNLAPVAESLK